MTYVLSGKRVWVAGHGGMVGAALGRRLEAQGCTLLKTDRAQVDLCRQDEVESWMADQKPQAVFVAAGKVGGIAANRSCPVDFLYDNLLIGANVIHAAHKTGVEKLLYLASSCSYPKDAPQPVPEEALLTGPLEPTNEWYAVAKIAGIKLCQAYMRQYGAAFISAVPNNAYGPGDNFHPDHSHVPASLLQRFHEAKLRGDEAVCIWGSGRPRREFLYVDDIADACIFLMKNYAQEPQVNISTGQSVSIKEFAQLVAKTVGFEGQLRFDTAHPDGMPRKELDTSRLTRLGWQAQIPLDQGLEKYYRWFLENQSNLRR